MPLYFNYIMRVESPRRHRGRTTALISGIIVVCPSAQAKPLATLTFLPPTLVEQAAAEGKDPLAVELGRRGGLKGGKVRAKRLSKKRRSEIARKAAQARWHKWQ